MKNRLFLTLILTLIPAAVMAQSVTGYVDRASLNAQVNAVAKAKARKNGLRLIELLGTIGSRHVAESEKDKVKPEIVKLMSKADLCVQNETGNTVLYAAYQASPLGDDLAKRVFREVLPQVAETCPDVLNAKVNGESVLDLAFYFERYEVIDLLIGAGAFVDTERYLREKALSYARGVAKRKGNGDVHAGPAVAKLLAMGADPTQAPMLLFYAIDTNDMDLLAKMLESPQIRKNLNNLVASDILDENKQTLLELAVEKDNVGAASMLLEAGIERKPMSCSSLEMADLLMKFGISVKIKNFAEFLEDAIWNSDFKRVDWLLRLDQKLNENERWWVFWWAGTYADAQIIKRLVQAWHPNKEEKDALMGGAWTAGQSWPYKEDKEKRMRAVRIVLAAGASPNAEVRCFEEDSDPSPVLVCALRDRDYALADLLLKAGANFNMKNADGYTIFQEVGCYHSHSIYVTKVTPGIRYGNGVTPDIKDRVYKGEVLDGIDRRCLNYLVSHGANINLRDSEGNTFLHDVVSEANDDSQGYGELVKVLVEEYGAKVNLENKNGQTPLDLAENETVRSYLKRHGAR